MRNEDYYQEFYLSMVYNILYNASFNANVSILNTYRKSLKSYNFNLAAPV